MEPRVPGAPGPGPRDWALVAVTTVAAVVETIARPDVVWRPVSLIVVAAIAWTLPWRRTRPLAMATIAVGTTSVLSAVAVVQDVRWDGLGSAVVMVLLPYSLTRWGSGRDVLAGTALFSVPVALTAAGGAPWGDVIGGALVLLLAFAVGAAPRYRRIVRQHEREGVRAQEREQLARELHDTVAHHVSAIAVQAQAGRVLADTRPDAAVEALAVIEEEASRTLEEMRSMVGALRAGDHARLTPLNGVADIVRLARTDGPPPVVEVALVGELGDLRPAIDTALFRLAQEAVTNAVRHARGATTVTVRVDGSVDHVSLTVSDDGHGGSSSASTTGFGLVGMSERVSLLGGTLEAGPCDGGWSVVAVLPRHGANS